MCVVDEMFLKHARRLRALFYGAGSVRDFATAALFDRGVILTSSWRASAVPVAEVAFAQIIMSLKKIYRFTAEFVARRSWSDAIEKSINVPGTFGSTVGIISLGSIGRLVLSFVKQLDVRICVYDVEVTHEEATELGVELCSLEELFQRSDVVSLHTALLPATQGMVTGPMINSMKDGATLINTARGALINQNEMVEILKARSDLTAVLDVFVGEYPEPDSPLFRLPNVQVTPHIAGAQQLECRRMGQSAIDECRRFLNREPLQHQITRDMLEFLA